MKKLHLVVILIVSGLFSVLLLNSCNHFSDDSVSNQLSPQRLQVPSTAIQPVNTTELQGITVQFAADRTQYMLGEPVLITVTARNETTDPILFHDGFDVIAGMIGVQISADGGEFRYYNGPFPVASQEFIISTLTPGTGRSLSFPILANRPSGPETLPHFYAFSKPGTYQLRAVLQNIIPNETLISGPISIEVLAPQGNDAQIWRLLQTQNSAVFLQTGYCSDPEKIASRFSLLLEKYPHSLYAPLMQTAIEMDQEIRGMKDATVQAANTESLPSLHEVNGLLYLVQTKVDDSVRATAVNDDVVLRQVIDGINSWVDAWNKRDFKSYAQSYSYQAYIRQDWQMGPGNRLYDERRQWTENSFAEKGTLAVDIIGFTVNTDEIIVEVVGQFSPGSGRNDTFSTMRFVKDDDGVWRIASPGF
jgi:hypothetical protein